MTSLQFSKVGVSYGERMALGDFSDNVKPGEWLCLIGPNGAGKSSLLRSVAGLVKHSGEIKVDGSPLRMRSPKRRAQLVAYVPQSPVLPDDMSVREYVVLGRNPFISHFGTETKHDWDIVDDVLRRLDLADFAQRTVGTLSGGEKQRVVIARAVAQEAPILLLDEPTSALDIGHQQQALELVDKLRKEHGLTVVSAMHDLTLAGLYSDRLCLIHQGYRVVTGTASEVLRAETLAEFYGVSVRVLHEPDGTVVVVPFRHVETNSDV
jgi:iron complex transport system ATP-binding protein